MPTRKIKLRDKWLPKICRHRDHEYPKHLVIKPGEAYEHVCPGCGRVTILRGPDVTW